MSSQSVLYLCKMDSLIIPIHSSITEIPFNKWEKDFTWQKFERMCQDLAEAEFQVKEIRPYGSLGDNQEGIDIYAFDQVERKYITLQCKRVKNYTPAKIKNAVDTFLNGNFKDNSSVFVLCCTDDLSIGKRQPALIKEELRLSKLGIKFLKWDFIGITKLLKKHPTIVGNTFTPEILKAFNGELAYQEYLKSFKLKVPKPKRIFYEYSQPYLQRTVSKIDEYHSRKNYYFEQTDRSLLDILNSSDNEKNKFIVLSQGGYGKSIELKYLANQFSKNELTKFFPIKIDLRNLISGEEIEKTIERYCSNWEGIVEKELLLLFDGLDEVNEKEYEGFIKRINLFSESHKEVTIVITSRTNYFNGTKGNSFFNAFEIMVLNDLNRKDIWDYIVSELKDDCNTFERIVIKYNFSDLLHSPFYLTSLVEIFKETHKNNTFPKTKSAIIKAIIDRQFEKAAIKFELEGIDLKSKKGIIETQLKKVAFSMTFLGRNSLKIEELQEIISDENERKLLKYSILDFINNEYQFSHNLVQEYLTGQYLTNLQVDKIKDLVSFKPNHIKVKNKWLNSLSFLLSSLNTNSELIGELVDWLSNIEPEVLINMEADKFKKELRHNIVVAIINKYREKKIHIPYQYFYDKDLVRFSGATKGILDFCLAEISNKKTPFETKLVCVRLLQKFENFYGKEKQTKQILLSCIIENVEYSYLQEQAAKALIPLSNYIDTSDCFSEILKSKNLNDTTLRNGILNFISTQEMRKDYIDFAIETIEILNSNEKRVTVMGEEKPIEEILLKSTEPEFVKIVFELIITDKSLLKDESNKKVTFDKDFVSLLIKNATKAYFKDKSIFSLIISFIERLKYRYTMYKYVEIVNPFFTETKTSAKAFNHFYKNCRTAKSENIWYQVEKMTLFATKLNMKRVFSDYEKGVISKDIILSCRNNLQGEVKKEMHDWFYDYINAKSENAFLYDEPKHFDWDKHRTKQYLRNQEMLIDKSIFLKEVKKIFTISKKTKLTKEELWDYRKKYIEDEDKLNNTLVLPLLREWAEHRSFIDFQTIYKTYSVEDKWQHYVINEIVRMLSNDKIEIREQLKQFAIKFVEKRFKTIDLKNSITETSEGSFTYTYYSQWLNLFCKKWDLDLPENILLDLLYTDYYSINDYADEKYEKRPANFIIEKINDKSLLKTRVLANLRGGRLGKRVLGTHLYMCKILNITEAKGFLYRELIGKSFDEYEKPKILEAYKQLGGEYSDLLEYYLTYSKLDYYFWDLTEKLSNEYQDEVYARLLFFIKEPSISIKDKATVSLGLLKLGKIEGITFFCDYISTYNTMPYDYHFASQLKANSFPYKKSLDLLFKTLEIPFSNRTKGEEDKPFERIDEAIYSLVFLIALNSDTAYNYAIKKYKEFYTANENKYKYVSFIHYPLNNLQNQYYINKEEKVGIVELMEIIKS